MLGIAGAGGSDGEAARGFAFAAPCLALPAPLAFLAFLPLSLAALPPLPPSFAAFFFLGGIEEVRTQGFEPPFVYSRR